jgi:cobalt-zinc-cadmium efflux system protein
MPHDHGHVHLDPARGDRRVAVAIWANGALTVAQLAGGLLSGSLALVADAAHNLSDMASLVVAFLARKVARRPADARMTFGYGRIELVAAVVNYTALILIGLYLIARGGLRLLDPPEVAGATVLVLGAVALAVDALTAALTWSMQKGSVNIRALFLHNLSDALGSLGVLAGGALILLYGWRWVDPALTIAIAAYILTLSLREIGGPVRTLMLGAPEGLEPARVLAAVEGVPGVAGMHHVHLWQMQEHRAALDAHVVLTAEAWPRLEEIKRQIKAALSAEVGITHSTLEFEHEARAHRGAALYGCADGGEAARAG